MPYMELINAECPNPQSRTFFVQHFFAQAQPIQSDIMKHLASKHPEIWEKIQREQK